MKIRLPVTACALVLAATPALANWSGTFSADYKNLQGPSWSQTTARLTGVAAAPLGWNNLSIQGMGQYEYNASDGFDWSEGEFNGTLFWTGSNARVAVSVQRTQVLDFSAWNAGGGAEFFVSPDWTLAVKGGTWWGTFGDSGGYVGGQATYYWNPNLAFAGTVQNSTVPGGRDLSAGLSGEYLAWDQISVYGGYTFVQTGDTPTHNFMIGLKFYCDGDGATTLVDHQRTGPVGYISQWDTLWFHD